MEDVNPADDPNNQGEDEFEEAEQEREENLPDENEKDEETGQKQGPPGMEEHLVVSTGKGSICRSFLRTAWHSLARERSTWVFKYLLSHIRRVQVEVRNYPWFVCYPWLPSAGSCSSGHPYFPSHKSPQEHPLVQSPCLRTNPFCATSTSPALGRL